MENSKNRTVICICLLVLSAPFCLANLITNPGFEVMEATDNKYPYTYGDWEGDISEIVISENGITPLEGSNMLHFIYAAGDYGPHTTVASQVRQTIDISAYADLIASGNAVAQLSGFFNRILGDAQTDTQFTVRIDAFAGEVSDYVNLARNQEQLAFSKADIFSDADTSTWEMAETELLIPTGTDFLAIQVQAVENIYNDTSGTEFDGHYCDEVCLQIKLPVSIDIKHKFCPNPLNVNSKGIFPVAILGSDDIDVRNIDITTITLEGISPVRSKFKDVAAPVIDGEICECNTDGPDGYEDLVLQFEAQLILDALGPVNDGDEIELTLSGMLMDEDIVIQGTDCVVIRGKL
jgi:hypothetical protein